MTGPEQPGRPEQPGQPWNWHPEGLPPSAMQKPDRHPAPVDIETARHLWFAVMLLGFFTYVLGLYQILGDRSTFAEQFVTELNAQDPSAQMSAETADSVLVVALVLAGFLGLGFAALFWLLTKKMRIGRLWARTGLTALGAVVVVSTVPSLFALGSAEGALAIVSTVAGILQAVAAAGAIYLMHRKESTEYFISMRKPRGDTPRM